MSPCGFNIKNIRQSGTNMRPYTHMDYNNKSDNLIYCSFLELPYAANILCLNFPMTMLPWNPLFAVK